MSGSVARKKCVEGDCYGTRMSRFITKRLFISIGFLIALGATMADGQAYRRPTGGNITPAMEAYRNRWLEYLKQRSSSTTTRRPFNNIWPGLRVGNDGSIQNQNQIHSNQNPDRPVINGFTCERTFSLFSNKGNPRMYHLCARRGDGWYVYHYFCPLGSTFNEGTKKCMHEQQPITPATVRTTTARIRRTTTTTSTTTPPPPPPLSTTTRRRTTRRTTTTTLRTTTITPPPSSSSSSTTEPVPEAEPGVTEKDGLFSSEESLTEDEVFFRDVDVNSASSSDEAEEVNSESYDDTKASDEINMISVGANGPQEESRLPDTDTTQLQTKKMQKTKKPTTSGGGGGVAAGGRRPRLFKKWRLQLGKY